MFALSKPGNRRLPVSEVTPPFKPNIAEAVPLCPVASIFCVRVDRGKARVVECRARLESTCTVGAGCKTWTYNF